MELLNKKVLVIGMARSGIAAAKLLKTLGANVILNEFKICSKLVRAVIS